jgi:hypothetical protein
VDALSRLVRLRRLDISCNRLATLAPLKSLASLECLAAERNRLPSLDGVDTMTSLIELYAASNALGSFRAESRRLGKLPGLAVVDLTGNPLVTDKEVRRPFEANKPSQLVAAGWNGNTCVKMKPLPNLSRAVAAVKHPRHHFGSMPPSLW